jgi:hypothetical protein
MNKILLGMLALFVSLNVNAENTMIMCHFDKVAVAKVDPALVDMHIARNQGFLIVDGEFREFTVINKKISSTVWYEVTSQSNHNVSYSGLNHGGHQTYGDVQLFQRSNGTYQVTVHSMVLLENKDKGSIFNSGSLKVLNEHC